MIIDAHQHFWNLEKVSYPWLVPEYGPIYRTFEAPELIPQLRAAGVDKTVLVQSMDSVEDTQYMLNVAAQNDWVAGVVGWVPLLDPDEAVRQLEHYKATTPIFKGMRHLIHTEVDPDWVVQDRVIESLKILAGYGYSFDVVAVFPNHLRHVPTLSEKIPNLRMVIDHLAKPPYPDAAGMALWREQFAAAAQNPNVFAKISGLNTAVGKADWTADDILPAIDYAVEHFGAQRLMFGGDWPVAILAGDYAKVVTESKAALGHLSPAGQDAIWSGTANRFYRLGL
ncbi:MAG: amidohydrolase family protein [Anaerolineae bacterium]|nr:amidohydrolase family protein [Anaerolineae bacterium]